MPGSSDSTGQLSAALAKAQMELVNPATSLTAVIYDRRAPEESRSYRYAPLSAGLEIVRKTLGRHELAVIQATDVDRESGLMLLTTKLAHASGEWIAATWPVCRIADLTSPRLMGAALTYARRYSLFALVGIAGDDDLDAPDLLQANGKGPVRPPMDGMADRSISAELFPEGRPNTEEVGSSELSPAVSRSCASNRKRRRASSIQNGLPTPSGASDAHLAALSTIKNPEALVRWALEALPFRNRISDETRASWDAAFLERARSIGADPELLLPFASSSPAEPSPEPPRLS